MEGFTEQEKIVLRRQLAIFIPVLSGSLGLWFLRDRGINLSFSVWGLNFSYSEALMILLDIGFGYVALSAIKHKVCVLGDEWEQKPIKGRAAVVGGSIIFIIMMILTISSLFTDMDNNVSF